MLRLRTVLCMVVALGIALLLTSASLRAQTAATSTVTGVVSDSTGAVVPNARVELTDINTNEKVSITTGNDGGYTFPSVRPGNYRLTVTAKGFRQGVVSGLKVEIGKSANVNLVLEVGAVTETVEVVAGAAVDLQTLDASVGDVLDASMLANMPTLSRDATALMLLQPMAIPGFNGPVGTSYGEGNSNGGTVAGARMDQNTFMIDGGDATSNMEGGGGYNTGFVASPRAAIPTPVESLEEFRVQTNNAGTDFTRSSGAEVQMVTIRGTNNWHGAGYWYHQNDELNANDWFRNRRGAENPEWRDNRAGGKIGGPIWKDRTFFFVHEEERHFFTQAVFQRLVPTAAERVGILKFKDASGVVRAYNLNPTPTLDPSAGPTDNDPRIGTVLPGTGTTYDPRAIGLSSAIAAEWATLPLPNDFSGGDGLRSAEFTSTSRFLQNEHFAVVRLDHKISDKWDFMGSYRYSTSAVAPPNKQEDIGGISPGCTKGVPCSLASRPLQPRFLVGSLTGRITPNLVNEFHFDWLRHWWAWIAPGVRTPVIPSSQSVDRLQIWQESRTLGMVPINVDTQNARQRTWNGQDYTYSDNLSWIRGKHAWSFGGRAQKQDFLHVRDDKVVGGLTTPIFYVARGGDFTNLTGFAAFRPPACTPGSTTDTNCLPVTLGGSTQNTNWARAYISALGLVDTASQVLTRDGNLNPQPAGSLIQQKEIVDAYEIYFSDTWRVGPSLTFSYGLTWGVQMPPYDPTGKTSMMIDASSGQVITADSLLNAKRLEAANGIVVNPTLAYVPIKSTGRKYPFDPDYTNFGPRLAAAWNPSFNGGFLGNFFGNKKTVLRGGWSRAFERKNGVGLVLTPALGIGFGDLSVCRTPGTKGACGAGGSPLTNFRVGSNADGNGSNVTITPLPVVSGGVIIPGQGGDVAPSVTPNSVFENRDFRIDPRVQTGSSDAIDVSLQRELPGKMVLEVGYVFRKSRDLYGNIELNHIPYMFKPKGVNQTFAQAFDAVAAQLQAGASTIAPQPWFETMLGGPTSAFCTGSPSCTAAAVGADSSGFWPSHGAGGVWSELETSFITGPMTAAHTQVASMDWTMSNTSANYNAGFLTLRSRNYHGLTFDANYTFSHALDNYGITQECTSVVTDAFDLHRNYGPSLFDRRHTFNLLVNYDLPLGKGKGWATSGVADKALGGWSVSGVYTAASGLPDMVWDDAACGTEFGATSANGVDVGLIPIKSGVINEGRNNNPTIGPNGFGSNSKPGPPNAFASPDAVAANFRHATFSDATLGFGAIRGPLRWNVDLAVAKKTRITERFSTRFDVQFVNAFNHVMFGSGSDSFFSFQPGADIGFPQAFGVPSNEFSVPRYIQIGLRFDF